MCPNVDTPDTAIVVVSDRVVSAGSVAGGASVSEHAPERFAVKTAATKNKHLMDWVLVITVIL